MKHASTLEISGELDRVAAGSPSQCYERPAIGVSSLRRNFGWTIVGNAVYTSTQWGILVLLARFGDPGAVGQFSLGLAIAAPAMLFAGLSLRAVQATDAKLQFQFADYAGLRIVTTIAAALGILGVGTVLYRGETALTILSFALTKGIESLSDVVYGLWQQQERMDLIAKSLIMRGLLALGVTGGCFALFHEVWVAVCGMATAWAVVFVAFDLRFGMAVARKTRQSLLPRFSRARMGQLFQLSLPLGIVAMLISFNANVPRYAITHFRSVRELGIFSALSYILSGGSMIVGALGQSATSRLALYASQVKTREFRTLSDRLILMGMTLGLCGIGVAAAFGRQIVTCIYGREYADQSLLLWLMVAATSTYMASFCGYSLTAARHFRIQLPLFGLVTLLTVGLSYRMVSAGGLVGAAKALAIVGLVQLTATVAVLRYLEPRRSPVVS